MRESVMMWSTSSISAILLKPLRPNLEESASTIVLGGLHHYAVEARFHHIGSGDAEVEVDAVYADKPLAARKVCQYVFCIFPYHGQTAVPQYAAELNNIDVLFACQDIR